MTNRENYLSLVHRTGYEKVPISFDMVPYLARQFEEYAQEHLLDYSFSHVHIPDLQPKPQNKEVFLPYYAGTTFGPGTEIDIYGVAREPGSKSDIYATSRMYYPLESIDSLEQLQAYPFPDFSGADATAQRAAVIQAKKDDRIAIGNVHCTIWEISWNMRSMEELLVDMMNEDEKATLLLDKITEQSIIRSESFARSGCDVLFLGDDIGMQHTIMMSEQLHERWLYPRLVKVIQAAKAIKPDILVYYHSCGYIQPFIPLLIEAGIDVLNPIQPECMDFEEIHNLYGDTISFHGTIGTQSTMPLGRPEEVREAVFRNLDIAGPQGGLLVCPTHVLEPDVPVENIAAYIKACQEYTA